MTALDDRRKKAKAERERARRLRESAPAVPELSDAVIRAVIEAWQRTGMMTEQSGEISPYICDRIRDEAKRVSEMMEATP